MQVLLVSPVFGYRNKPFTGKHFILFYILLWIQFYKLDLVLITLLLPELRKVAKTCQNENYQKQLALTIDPLVESIEKYTVIVYNYVP